MVGRLLLPGRFEWQSQTVPLSCPLPAAEEIDGATKTATSAAARTSSFFRMIGSFSVLPVLDGRLGRSVMRVVEFSANGDAGVSNVHREPCVIERLHDGPAFASG
jgi:hypothetical protein